MTGLTRESKPAKPDALEGGGENDAEEQRRDLPAGRFANKIRP